MMTLDQRKLAETGLERAKAALENAYCGASPVLEADYAFIALRHTVENLVKTLDVMLDPKNGL